MSFFNRLKDFCAINFPAAYESVYRFRHGIHLEDLGETVAVRSKELTEHIRLKNRKDLP
ncbi:MAG: hypothetical protein II902_01760 [Selenomonadaceae bacterium]|nr:hypothetical protein [Selenomonadaceae bacterium]